jgi:hypothetical protein
MYIELTKNEMVSELLKDEFANWTLEGAFCLIEMLEEMEDDTGELMEFNRIDLRSEFTEYSSLEEAAADYDIPEDEDALEWFYNQTWINEFKTATGGTGLILRQF